jgi:rhamnogalacturonyl hydrolase YesR
MSRSRPRLNRSTAAAEARLLPTRQVWHWEHGAVLDAKQQIYRDRDSKRP